MDDWTYCNQTLIKVSRTFALNIRVLRGDLHRSVLIAYLFCRTVDTVEDAAKLDPKIKIKQLFEFSRLIENQEYRRNHIDKWIKDCDIVDGNHNDLNLLKNIKRVFNIFDSLKGKSQETDYSVGLKNG
jgi:Phytoene/squalene synthetase